MKKQLKSTKNKVISIRFGMLIFVFLMGCAGIDKMSPFQMDEMLVRAGFQMHTADTPKKLDFLKSLPQNELVHKTYNEKVSYFYVDGSSCQCMYVGDEQAYQRFRQLVKEEQMDEKIETTSHQAQDRMGNIDIDPNNPLDIEGHLP
ncbi:MAG: hypothetical protein PVF42_12025 [Desulfobacterales bacterium]|jgi:hypothetical protein